MALAAIINKDAWDGLSDELKQEYMPQEDETYLLDVAPVGDFALENVKGLKSALSAERASREKAEGLVKPFEGLDPEKARVALKKVEEMANWRPEDKVKEQIETLKTQLDEKHRVELKALQDRLDKRTRQVEKVLVEANAVKALADAKGNAELLLPHVKAATRLRETENGEFVVEVVGVDGNVRISPATGKTGPMSIEELVAEMKQSATYGVCFEGTGASGSGATGSAGGTPPGRTSGYTINATDARDPAKYRAAKEAAAKAGVTLQMVEG